MNTKETMLNTEVLTFQEFVTHAPLPLSKIQGAVLEFLQGRDDAVLFGAVSEILLDRNASPFAL